MLEMVPGFSSLEANAFQGLIVLPRAALDRVASALVLERRHKLERPDVDSSLGALQMLLLLPLQPHPPPSPLVPLLEDLPSTQRAKRMLAMAKQFNSLADSAFRERTVPLLAALVHLAYAVVWEHKLKLGRRAVGLFPVRSF
jgi:hypothetical protein